MRKILAFLVTVLSAGMGVAAEPGSAVCWGYDIGPPPSDVDLVEVDAGQQHCVALKTDGSLTGWGNDTKGQVSNRPLGMFYIDVAAGASVSLALKTDHSLVAWGNFASGLRTDVPTSADIATVEGGRDWGVAIRLDGSLVSWGEDTEGQVSNLPAGTNFKAISAGDTHGLALTASGGLVSWGSNSDGQVADTPVDLNYTKIACGTNYSLAIKNDGTIVGWGSDTYSTISDIPAGSDFVAVEASAAHSLALRSDGSLISWGTDYSGVIDETPDDNCFSQISLPTSDIWSFALKLPPVPELLNYQGIVQDSMGTPLDGVSVDLTFRFYDALISGDLLLSAQQTDVEVTDGLFNVLIGAGAVIAGTEDTIQDVFQNHRQVYMSTEVGSDGEMSPRRRIATAGYALSARTASDLTHVRPRSTAPSDPVEGDIYWDSTAHTLMAYDGTTWQPCW